MKVPTVIVVVVSLTVFLATADGMRIKRSVEENRNLLRALFREIMQEQLIAKRCLQLGGTCRTTSNCCAGLKCESKSLGTWSGRMCLDDESSGNLRKMGKAGSCSSDQKYECEKARANCPTSASCSDSGGRKSVHNACGGWSYEAC
ncbi:uncharacterized protein LOC141906912 [Tubulanus polymorphus]|uniref:uncharacterized protein LOC141906912 n=1 Tax=Tubulanus polymorphus TaxID=672921 RepID=UPI003DA35018